MICTECGGKTKVIETRESELFTLRRRRECVACGERFNTYEVHERVVASAQDAMQKKARAIAKQIELTKLRVLAANRLHEGADKLAAELGMHPKSIEKRARKGREHLKKLRDRANKL